MTATSTTVTPNPKLSSAYSYSHYFQNHSSPKWTLEMNACKWHHCRRGQMIVTKASSSGSGNKEKAGKRSTNTKKSNTNTNPDALTQQQQQQQQQPVSISLDDVNPVGLGRKSRQIFDEVWRKFSGLGQISRTTRADDKDSLDALLIREGPMCEFAIPGAQNTTVLVVGATSRIGRIVIRKLMLRGYSVK
ncbi:hypothetical protein CISIN_1g0075871mg, partial [Citrus sinensis]